MNITAADLTLADIFKLGQADLSFGIGDCDMGIHILLPVGEYVDGKPNYEPEHMENTVFEELFTEYFDKIPHSNKMNEAQKAYMKAMSKEEGGNDMYCWLYRGAILAFGRDLGIKLMNDKHNSGWEDWLVQSFRDIVKLNS